VLDTGAMTGSVAGEIIARAVVDCWDHLKTRPQRITMPDIPEPTSFGLTRAFHPCAEDVVQTVHAMLGRRAASEVKLGRAGAPHDVPGDWFKGPF